MYSHATSTREAAVHVTHREVVDRLVTEVMNGGRLEVIDDLYTPGLAATARRWIAPFLTSSSDVDMRVVDVVSEGDRAAARFSCSGTHTGTWQGHPPTGRRFTNVAEVYFFRFEGARIAQAWGLEDNLTRLRHLRLSPGSSPSP
jgi:SnoaL-like polyketide cyclase